MLRVSLGLFGLYTLYAIAGALAQKSGSTLPFKLGDVGEFLLVLASCTALIVHLVRLELQAPGQPRQTLWQVLDENAERYAMLVFYVFVCVVIVQEVLRRFVLNFSSAWAEETARYAFIYLGYVGAAYAVKERAHIRFDILINRLPDRLKGWLYILAEVSTALFAMIAIYWSWHSIQKLIEFDGLTPVLRISKVYFEFAVPLGFALVLVRCVQAIMRDLSDLRAGRPVYVGKAMFEE